MGSAASTAPEFHLFLPQLRMTADAIVERALAAEAAGFEGIAFMDHLAPPMAGEHDMLEAMTIAGWVLARTTTLTVGHLVLCDGFRHPAVLARQAATLDSASGGRFELGIGWGSTPDELETFGVGPRAARDRVARLAESLEIMRALWAGETVDHRGEHFTLTGARQRPVPARRIPITIGGTGPRTLELVRAHADWWNVPVNRLDRRAELRDRAGGARVSVQTMVAPVPDERDRAEVTATARRRFGAAMGDGLVIGTAPELAAHFSGLHADGVDRFYVWFADFAPAETLRRFAAVLAEVKLNI
ncbi:LLM class flavin-dependent oxidoreductase [Actinomadura sp. WMMB 499]|uniref:LLM class flavin-dependent oxidoreductase n=1 Tax=Actinomadura sp. WMMB 499 TaxID=1219491 RepID=UPI0012476199|nr:LLM class flavin-dependent oxidoreductase [Actinomadura sp. WMMB 499]QFG26213.1 LLM class flavin-dependent oxidoreductase [Actinomadura sp. WMMB 499]